MAHNNKDLENILHNIKLGSSVAEFDDILNVARVDTSAFSDIFNDNVDLIPGTKGSGKTALFRIFVDFLPDTLLENRKVVIAHGVQKEGDSVFHAYKDKFEKLTEDDFVNFWCIYLTSLAQEQFIKGPRYRELLKNAKNEIAAFRNACDTARIPEIKSRKTLSEILDWTLHALNFFKPSITYKEPTTGGEIQLDLFGQPKALKNVKSSPDSTIPIYISLIKLKLEDVLRKTNLKVWLMIDKLDEIFPRRSPLESRALRGLLRVMRVFMSPEIRVKVFLRDDMLENILSSGNGFTALTHVTARQSDTLRWSEDQILTFVVKRLFSNEQLCQYCQVDNDRLHASVEYQKECFDKVFPKTVHRGVNQSSTIRWIYSHTQDGRGVVTPRDVLDLLTTARQQQLNICIADPAGNNTDIIGSSAILYGLEELSKRKRKTFLEAEFPHMWSEIAKLIGGKTEYTKRALQNIYGKETEKIVEDIVSLGVLKPRLINKKESYWIPYLYRKGLEVSQGKA
ncbi:MAG: hypothetical protein HF981_13175 [Desulfobacteraceae bacterium]|nr:hypothetical protein [Desulfobacteraceae bacterium]MBC2751333.1 hypothetical protein [Desulfobacteraceae bacterium]